MAWHTPKTDWAVRYDAQGNYAGDYFNAGDYQRIKHNLLFLKELADVLYAPTMLPDIPDITALSYCYETVINALERSIDALRSATFDPGLPATKIWQGNAAAPLAADLNRIESCCLMLYQTLTLQSATQRRLAFTLGGVQF